MPAVGHEGHATKTNPGVVTADERTANTGSVRRDRDKRGTTTGRRLGSGPSGKWQRLASSNLFLGLVLAVVAWPTSANSLFVLPGLSSSWRAALTMAAHNHMAFGTQVVFTYGPLTFLVTPMMYFASYAILAFLFTLAFTTALFSSLVWSLRQTIPLSLAVAAAFLVGGVSRLSSNYFGTNVAVEDVLALVLILCVFALSRPRDKPAPAWIWICLGGVLSIFSLIKVSLGLAIVVVILITVAFLPSGRRRALGNLALGSVPLFCLAWFGTGNGFQNLIGFVRSSAAVISGYGAMSYESPTLGYTYWLAAFVSVLIGTFALAHSRRLVRSSQFGIAMVTLATMWFLFKEGFVRHDSHDLVFFVAAPIVLAAFSPMWRSKAWQISAMLGLTFVAASVALTVPQLVTQPVQAARNFANQAITLALPGRQHAVTDQSRRSLQADYRLPTEMLALMQGQTVAVSPWEQTVVWAYPRLRFDPLPVIGDYSAYTPSLDQLDASFLASANAPRYILRQPQFAVDGRNPTFEPPATQLAIECRYHQVAVYYTWQLLERQPDRCGHPRPLGAITTGLLDVVKVPSAPPGDVIVASFDLSNDWWSKLESLLYKPPTVVLIANDGQQGWRFVADTGPDLHVLRASSALGYVPAFVPVPIHSLRFSIAGEGRSASGIRISFFAVPMTRVKGSSAG